MCAGKLQSHDDLGDLKEFCHSAKWGEELSISGLQLSWNTGHILRCLFFLSGIF